MRLHQCADLCVKCGATETRIGACVPQRTQRKESTHHNNLQVATPMDSPNPPVPHDGPLSIGPNMPSWSAYNASRPLRGSECRPAARNSQKRDTSTAKSHRHVRRPPCGRATARGWCLLCSRCRRRAPATSPPPRVALPAAHTRSEARNTCND